jgi:PIN domain nuclease of toxin-antitoxin system
MILLLDTHAFMWWAGEPEKLSPPALTAVENRANQLMLSVATVWEMQIKHQLGKLELDLPLEEIVQREQGAKNLEILSIGIDSVLKLDDLPLHHRDPFDRILIAQTLVLNAVLVTSDPVFSQYSVSTLW